MAGLRSFSPSVGVAFPDPKLAFGFAGQSGAVPGVRIGDQRLTSILADEKPLDGLGVEPAVFSPTVLNDFTWGARLARASGYRSCCVTTAPLCDNVSARPPWSRSATSRCCSRPHRELHRLLLLARPRHQRR